MCCFSSGLFDSVGRMLHLVYCWHQMHCGNSFPLLGQPTPNLHHAPIGFSSLLQTFLVNTEIAIHLIPSLLRLPKPLRRGDLNLSDSFDTLGWKGPKRRLLITTVDYSSEWKPSWNSAIPIDPVSFPRPGLPASPTQKHPPLAQSGSPHLMGPLAPGPGQTLPSRPLGHTSQA
jgi:hypothetical protein